MLTCITSRACAKNRELRSSSQALTHIPSHSFQLMAFHSSFSCTFLDQTERQILEKSTVAIIFLLFGLLSSCSAIMHLDHYIVVTLCLQLFNKVMHVDHYDGNWQRALGNEHENKYFFVNYEWKSRWCRCWLRIYAFRTRSFGFVPVIFAADMLISCFLFYRLDSCSESLFKFYWFCSCFAASAEANAALTPTRDKSICFPVLGCLFYQSKFFLPKLSLLWLAWSLLARACVPTWYCRSCFQVCAAFWALAMNINDKRLLLCICCPPLPLSWSALIGCSSLLRFLVVVGGAQQTMAENGACYFLLFLVFNLRTACFKLCALSLLSAGANVGRYSRVPLVEHWDDVSPAFASLRSLHLRSSFIHISHRFSLFSLLYALRGRLWVSFDKHPYSQYLQSGRIAPQILSSGGTLICSSVSFLPAYFCAFCFFMIVSISVFESFPSIV